MIARAVPPGPGPWTVDDLMDLPEDGNRYELIEGNLLISPPRWIPQFRTVLRLRDVLLAARPADLEVGEHVTVVVGSPRTCFVPDLWVAPASALDRCGAYVESGELVLAVEVLPPGETDLDSVAKRHFYALGGVARYWIVDPQERTLTVCALAAGRTYSEEIVVPAGTTWRADLPFPVDLDPAVFC